MRQRYLLVLVGLVVVALAVGALPSLLQSGDPYRVHATDVGNASSFDGAAYDATNVSDRRFPYVTGAIENGTSERYYEGPFGVKEAFAHSPFDEFGAIETRAPAAIDDGVAHVTYDGTVYRLEIVREDA
ncbi:hypothetical protein G9C85_11140 [Halorubellus sp. JP-L1]|uniref:hypothetical protein n=1 Tax=Halorubellus sp. JP-L1 TaxID=2715753 RepID=UPI001409198F|nr:hypothetical protein [Halorubellus sp. JP-L1]NHN42176.1 hypothetical protein [Halorubellus sp. JP-L1]